VAIDFALKVHSRIFCFLLLELFLFLRANRQVPASERTIWKFLVRDDCLHFKALKDNALLPGEEEFLFAPYSAFEVQSNRIEQIQYEVKTVKKSAQMRVICLVALSDNKDPRAKDAPTAPRY
jgi:hypothetical protein